MEGPVAPADHDQRRALVARVAVTAALFAIAFGPYIASGFLLDDYFHLERLRQPTDLGVLRFAIDTDRHALFLWPRPAGVQFDYFRPLVMLSLLFDWRLWGAHAAGFHFSNLLFHGLNIWLVYRLARRLALSTTPAWLAALAWGLGLNTGPAVGWVSGRTEILAATGVLLAALAFLRWRDGGSDGWLVLSVAYLILACSAKESAVIAPLLFVLVSRLAPGRHRPVGILPLGVLCLPSALTVVLRLWLLHLPLPPPPYFQLPASPADFAVPLTNGIAYLLAALLSVPLLPLGPVPWLLDRPLLLLPAATVAGGLVLALRRWAAPRVAAGLLAWFVAGLLPYAPVMAGSLYLYLPLVGITLLLGSTLERTRRAAPRAWLAWFIVAGVVGNAATGLWIGAVSRAGERAAAYIAQALRAGRDSHLVVADAPVWTYALPAAIRLRAPDLGFDTHFLTFAPGLRPEVRSAARWRDSLTLELRPVRGTFFTSSVERFMLFGPPPSTAVVAARPPLAAVVISGDPSRPSALAFRFRGTADLRASLIVQFRGWQPEVLAPPP